MATGSVAPLGSRPVIPASALPAASCRAVRPYESVSAKSAPSCSNIVTSVRMLRGICKIHLLKSAETCRVVSAGGAIPPTHGSPQPMHLPNQTPPAPLWPLGGREVVGCSSAVAQTDI